MGKERSPGKVPSPSLDFRASNAPEDPAQRTRSPGRWKAETHD